MRQISKACTNKRPVYSSWSSFEPQECLAQLLNQGSLARQSLQWVVMPWLVSPTTIHSTYFVPYAKYCIHTWSHLPRTALLLVFSTTASESYYKPSGIDNWTKKIWWCFIHLEATYEQEYLSATRSMPTSNSHIIMFAVYELLNEDDEVALAELPTLTHSAWDTRISTLSHSHTHYNLDLTRQVFTCAIVQDGIRTG